MSEKKHNYEKSLGYSAKKKCKEGYYKKNSYISHSGTRVPARCVRSTTVYKNTGKHKRSTVYVPSIKTLAKKACPPGMIERKAYTRKFSNNIKQKGYTVRRSSGTVYLVHPKVQGSTVKPTCIKDRGKPKTRIVVRRKGELSKFGYSFRISDDKRHTALRQAVNEFGALGVYRKLDAVAKLSKTTIPEASRIFENDREWVKSHFGPITDSKK